MATGQYINIKDSKGFIHTWVIEEETKNSYKIFCNGFISEICIKHTYMKDGVLYTSDIRNPFSNIELKKGKKYAKAAYCEILL